MNSFDAYPERVVLRTPPQASVERGAALRVQPAAAPAGGLSAERAVALRDVWFALWSSRLLVWVAAMATILAFGFGPVRHVLNPPGVTRGFGWLGDLLAAPAARWDSAWYLVIAHYGYRPELGTLTASRDAFFPLYPLSLSGLSGLGLPPVLAGVAVSVCALAVALYALHRLTMLEWASRDTARLAVLLTAFAPMAFYLSAVYSESLYLALSAGLFLCARRGRWGLAATLGALASATRSTGVLLVVPLALLYLYGPREDRPPDGQPKGRLAPRYRVRPDALWIMLVPAGLALYMAHLALAGGEALAPFHAQGVWNRHFAGPYVAVWDGAKAAFDGARQLLSLQIRHVYFRAGLGNPFTVAWHNLMLFAFLLAALPALAGVARRLPFAYTAYVLAALALPLSYPVASQPLMSLPRFLLVLFPLNMWLAAWLAERSSGTRGRSGVLSGPRVRTGVLSGPRVRSAVLVSSALCMCVFAAQFATWHWVA